jgi:hypothetical protein
MLAYCLPNLRHNVEPNRTRSNLTQVLYVKVPINIEVRYKIHKPKFVDFILLLIDLVNLPIF